jgi:hypothetical protein
MNLSRIIELTGGILTLILAFIIPMSFPTSPGLSEAHVRQGEETKLMIFYIPAILFAAGCAAHALAESKSGRFLAFIATGFYVLTLPIFFVGGAYAGGLIKAFIIMIPSIAAILTVIASDISKPAPPLRW